MADNQGRRTRLSSWLKVGVWSGATVAALLTMAALAAPLTGVIDRGAEPGEKVAPTATAKADPAPKVATPAKPGPTTAAKTPTPDTAKELEDKAYEAAPETKQAQPPAEKTPPPPVIPEGGVEFLAVLGAAPGGGAAVKVQTAPGASCSIIYVNPAGVTSTSPKLAPKTANDEGRAAWGWKIPEDEPVGTGTVSVTCNGATVSAPITIG